MVDRLRYLRKNEGQKSSQKGGKTLLFVIGKNDLIFEIIFAETPFLAPFWPKKGIIKWSRMSNWKVQIRPKTKGF